MPTAHPHIMKNKLHTLALLLSATLLLPSSPTHADELPTGISVTGECLKKVQRDRGAVTISSSIVAPTAKDSSKKAIEAHEKIKSQIQALKLPDLTVATAGYSVNQECDYNPKISSRQCSGYRTTISTKFETPNFTHLEDVIGIASQNDAQDVSQLEAFVSPSLLKAERESCLEIATKNAQAKAEKIATGAGVKLAKLISVSEGAEQKYQPPMSRGLMAMSAAEGNKSSVGPSLDAEPYDLQVAVSAVYGIQ